MNCCWSVSSSFRQRLDVKAAEVVGGDTGGLAIGIIQQSKHNANIERHWIKLWKVQMNFSALLVREQSIYISITGSSSSAGRKARMIAVSHTLNTVQKVSRQGSVAFPVSPLPFNYRSAKRPGRSLSEEKKKKKKKTWPRVLRLGQLAPFNIRSNACRLRTPSYRPSHLFPSAVN